LCAYSVFNTFPVYPLSAKPLILLAFCRYRYHTSLFNRPGFAALLEEIEAGHVGVLIVKDLSRFGRNYLQVGYYTEILFPKKGVRFIAINNNVDSATPQDNDFTPFLNIMNEWYAKDTSKGRFSFRLIAPYSEERRKAASEAAKQNSVNKL
jgi:site-specific DNA recombinase